VRLFQSVDPVLRLRNMTIASGVYLYQLKTEDFMDTKQLMLVK